MRVAAIVPMYKQARVSFYASTRTAIRCCVEPVRRNVLPLCRRVIRHKARVNARESLHKGCGERDRDGATLHRATGKRKSKRKRERKKIPCRFVLARSISSTWKQLTLS